jgi:hypothetical protein
MSTGMHITYNFHKIWYECYANEDCLKLIILNFLVSNINMMDARTCEAGLLWWHHYPWSPMMMSSPLTSASMHKKLKHLHEIWYGCYATQRDFKLTISKFLQHCKKKKSQFDEYWNLSVKWWSSVIMSFIHNAAIYVWLYELFILSDYYLNNLISHPQDVAQKTPLQFLCICRA